MPSLLQDIRFALRTLGRSPGFAAAAILCLALGIGATTAIFSVVYSVILRPLPFQQPEKLVRIYTEFPTFPNGGLRKFWTSPPEFLEMKRESRAWESLEAWVNSGVNIAGTDQPVRATSSSISGGMLTMLGVQPEFGRVIAPSDDHPDAPLVAVISHGLWQRSFGGDRNVLEREIRINGNVARVVGVMRQGFAFPPGESDPPEVWTPLRLNPANPGGRGSHFLFLLGRLKSGVSYEQARQDMERLTVEWGKIETPNFHHIQPKFHPLITSPLHEEVVASVRPALLAMLAAVGFVLLIACVNVANLLLARAEVRQREIAVRRAMGASTLNLVRQLTVEGTVLSLAGALLGIGLAYGGLRLIVAASQNSIPRYAEIGIDGRVLLFTLAVSIATGLFFGLAPLAQFLAHSLHDALKAGGRTTGTVHAHRLRQTMVVGELALALVLLIGSGLMLRAFWKLQAVNIGMRSDNLVTMRFALPQGMYRENSQVREFWRTVQDRMAAIPGVASSTIMTGLPPIRQLNANDTQIEGFGPDYQKQGLMQNVDYYQIVGRRFFETLGIPLIEGRYLDDRDASNAPAVVVINQTMARTFWPGQSPIGRRIRPNFQDPWRTIVGVVGDVKNAGIDRPAGTELFMPAEQVDGGGRGAIIVLRAHGDPNSLIGPARRVVSDVNAALPVSNVRTMDDVVFRAKSRPRFLAILLTLFSSVALVLGALGIYGVTSYVVAQRTSEIGIRMAIGASPGNVLTMILGGGVKIGLVGVAVGAIGALLLTRFLKGLLFGIDALDPLTFVAMAGLLGLVILLACYVPARRATKVDPLVALRYE